MKVTKKELKDVLTIAKRLVDKKTGKMLLRSEEKVVKIQLGNPNIVAYFKIENQSEEHFSILLNPYDLESLIKAKETVFEFELEKATKGEFLIEKKSKQKIQVKTFERDIIIEFDEKIDFQEIQNKTTLISLFKETENVYQQTELEGTNYLHLNKNGALALEPMRVHYYRFKESFPFESGFVHSDVVKFLSKTIKKDVYQGMLNHESWVLKHENAFFVIKIIKKVAMPNLRELQREKEPIFSFDVDAKELNLLLKSYTKKCKKVEIQLQSDKMIFVPRTEEFEVQSIPVSNIKGNLKNVLFETEAIKGILNGYEETITIQHQNYTNILGEPGYMWWVYEPVKMVMVAGITEPDHQKEWEKAMEELKDIK